MKITFDAYPPTIEWGGRPILRLMWIRGCRSIDLHRAEYYGYTWWLGIGPLQILVGSSDDGP